MRTGQLNRSTLPIPILDGRDLVANETNALVATKVNAHICTGVRRCPQPVPILANTNYDPSGAEFIGKPLMSFQFASFLGLSVRSWRGICDG